MFLEQILVSGYPRPRPKTSQKNIEMSRRAQQRGTFYSNEDIMNSSPSKCPPTTMKKSHPRQGYLSPPKSLRAHGRANSLL
eukprot:scaffold132901_cov31-Cyclotella_meneghiniana.AAC.1